MDTETDSRGSLIVRAESALVAGDFHVPGHHEIWCQRLIRYGVDNKIKTLVVNGDFWHNDSLSSFEIKDPNMTLKEELRLGALLLRRLSAVFRVYFIQGNHDLRLIRALKYSIGYDEWMATFNKKIVVTNYDHLFLVSGGKKFRCCHPENYSKIKGNVTVNLAQDLQENILGSHSHYLYQATNKQARHIAMDIGCMCRSDAFLYKNSCSTRFPSWEQGFVHALNGKVRVISALTF